MLLLIIVSCDNNFGSFIKTFCKNNDELQRIYKELSHVHYTEIVIGMFQASCGKSSRSIFSIFSKQYLFMYRLKELYIYNLKNLKMRRKK